MADNRPTTYVVIALGNEAMPATEADIAVVLQAIAPLKASVVRDRRICNLISTHFILAALDREYEKPADTDELEPL